MNTSSRNEFEAKEDERFAPVDEMLNAATRKLGVVLYRRYKDDVVRSFDVMNSAGNTYQIWVAVPTGDSDIFAINIWHRDQRGTVRLESTVAQFPVMLESAIQHALADIPTGTRCSIRDAANQRPVLKILLGILVVFLFGGAFLVSVTTRGREDNATRALLACFLLAMASQLIYLQLSILRR